jgi:hypothetical protein
MAGDPARAVREDQGATPRQRQHTAGTGCHWTSGRRQHHERAGRQTVTVSASSAPRLGAVRFWSSSAPTRPRPPQRPGCAERRKATSPSMSRSGRQTRGTSPRRSLSGLRHRTRAKQARNAAQSASRARARPRTRHQRAQCMRGLRRRVPQTLGSTRTPTRSRPKRCNGSAERSWPGAGDGETQGPRLSRQRHQPWLLRQQKASAVLRNADAQTETRLHGPGFLW